MYMYTYSTTVRHDRVNVLSKLPTVKRIQKLKYLKKPAFESKSCGYSTDIPQLLLAFRNSHF